MNAFCAIFSQWRIVALASGRMFYSGLDYAGTRAGLEEAGIAVTPQLWAGIRIMEIEAKRVLNG